jgi:hypothetical protein
MAYDVAAWSGFLTAASAVSGVLLGLMITAITVRISLIQADTPFARRNYQLLIILFDTLIYALVPLAPIHRIAVGVIIAVLGLAAFYHFTYFLYASPSRAGSPAPSKTSPNEQSQVQSSWVGRLVLWRPLVIVLAPSPLIVGGITLAARGGGGFYWSMFGLVTTTGYALIYLWLVIVRHRSEQVNP